MLGAKEELIPLIPVHRIAPFIPARLLLISSRKDREASACGLKKLEFQKFQMNQDAFLEEFVFGP